MASDDGIYTSPYEELSIPDNLSLPDFVFQNVGSFSDRVFIQDGERGYSFGETKGAVERVGAAFVERGVSSHDVVCIFSPNLPEYPIAFHGVLKAGAILTTCSPLYTASELNHQLKDSGVSYIITIPQFLDKVKEAQETAPLKEIFVFGEAEGCVPFKSLLASTGPVPEPKANWREKVALILYSSGTTGLPKGVCLSHYNLISNILQVRSCESDIEGGKDVFMGILPFYHAFAVIVIMNLALRVGVSVVSMPRFDLVKFLELASKFKATYLHIVPPIVLALAKHPIVEKYDLSAVKFIFSGAAPLSSQVEQMVRERLKVGVKQGYGMTEMSPASHVLPSHTQKSGSIGPLLPNCTAKLLDVSDGSLVTERGKEGELCVKGPNIMLRYHNNPEATKGCIDDEGYLHTGDVAMADQDGDFFIVDRVKELIKYKGYQVAPAELEAKLLTHPGVTDVAVVGKYDLEAGELPKAYLVLKEGTSPEEVLEWFNSSVAPTKKLRGGIEVTDAIPKSLSGKILRKELRAKERAAAPHLN